MSNSKQHTDNSIDSPFHSGEKEMQVRVGKSDDMEKAGRFAIRSYLTEQHRLFFNQLPFFVIGSVDNEQWPWASILSGNPGFLHSPEPNTLNINAQLLSDDPLGESMKIGSPLGMLGIELPTRRRNRANARVSQVNGTGFAVKIDQAFGNCPQYIQTRSVDFVNEPESHSDDAKKHASKITDLDDSATHLISTADTFFVSSFLPVKDHATREGVDVSHRGGSSGFIKVEGNTLTIPDFPGNNFFNTMGNFLLNPKAGLTFIDFDTGDMLMLTGTVELIDSTDEKITSFKGAQRGWRFTVDHGLKFVAALPFRSTLKEYSINSLLAGTWQQANAELAARKTKDAWRSFNIARIEDESSVIRSFYLKPSKDEGLISFEAGHFITVGVTPTDSNEEFTRTYTVSSAPGEAHYRISVKREEHGVVSKYLHDVLNVGDSLKIKSPAGEFYIDPTETRPAVLLAGGVGVTPMISMAHHAQRYGITNRHTRPLHIFHSAQTVEQRAFAKEFKEIAVNSDNKIHYYSLINQAKSKHKLGNDFDFSGYITADIFRQTLPLDDYDFYLCGPAPFMHSVYDTLMSLGVSDKKIFAESFGPAVLKRHHDEELIEAKEAESVIIKFTESGFEHSWNEGEETLLELAESHGLTPSFSCRNGVCGSCATKIKSGRVAYRNTTAPHNDDEILICCAVPAAGCDVLEIEL